MKCVCGRVIWCVLYSQLEEGALLQWFEWFCPLCLTVAKAFGCGIKSLMIAHHLGRGKMHFWQFQADFIQKNWAGYDTEWSLWWSACVFQMGSHTQHLLQVLLAAQTLKEGCSDHWLHHHQAALLQWWWFRELWTAQGLTEYFKLVASHYVLTYPAAFNLPPPCLMQGLGMEESYWWTWKIILTHLCSSMQPVWRFTKKPQITPKSQHDGFGRGRASLKSVSRAWIPKEQQKLDLVNKTRCSC